ncbi:hypothetical protein KC343_g11010 [Hortaea werneckii]|uniref:Uncharacterized protein n=1 Tax=Hortaea werneckii TaxID=91943 RepID=A0A3M7C0W1_HORWE|nr:hypothetical protein KC352_g23056 [Hortaea werneckii]KAI7555741.1 hypothetical protein KC317_g12745 [Hortaea werneckii]KAI7613080.1 hypothetical protein KC343_g11010 [Hortaea werneckii]KAI7613660.1 hypothetical protein KC346_g7269 [Hortaea werneckii]KAI7694564.1 hypothetical protein KC322_g10346 [Hortaea werneckii]
MDPTPSEMDTREADKVAKEVLDSAHEDFGPATITEHAGCDVNSYITPGERYEAAAKVLDRLEPIYASAKQKKEVAEAEFAAIDAERAGKSFRSDQRELDDEWRVAHDSLVVADSNLNLIHDEYEDAKANVDSMRVDHEDESKDVEIEKMKAEIQYLNSTIDWQQEEIHRLQFKRNRDLSNFKIKNGVLKESLASQGEFINQLEERNLAIETQHETMMNECNTWYGHFMHAQNVIDELNAELRALKSSSHDAGRVPPELVAEGTSSKLRPSSSSDTVVIRQDLSHAHEAQFGNVGSSPQNTWQNSRFTEALPSSPTYHNFPEGVAAVPDNQGNFHSYAGQPGLVGMSGLASDLARMQLRQPSMSTIKRVSSSGTIKSDSSSTKTVTQSDYTLKKAEDCPWHCNQCYPLPPEVQAASGRRCTMDPLGVDKASAAMSL